MEVIPRAEALARLGNERADCLVCSLLGGQHGPPLILREGEHVAALLPRYATRRGHVMVVSRRCVSRVVDLDMAVWRELTDVAFAAAQRVEAALSPLRCYIASLGTSHDDLPMTSPHVHMHVIPIYAAEDKPSTVLTWEHGVHVADETEWSALVDELRF